MFIYSFYKYNKQAYRKHNRKEGNSDDKNYTYRLRYLEVSGNPLVGPAIGGKSTAGGGREESCPSCPVPALPGIGGRGEGV